MSFSDSAYWLALSRCPQVGPKRFFEIANFLEAHSYSIQDFWKFSEKRLLDIGLPQSFLPIFQKHRASFDIAGTLAHLKKNEITTISVFDASYPKLLQEIPDKPPILYVKGDFTKINEKPIAVVGTRKITSYGKMVTRKFVADLVQQGYSIISGFMYGVDGEAHQSAIDAGGYTVGVLGYGFDYLYPKSHAKLMTDVLRSGGALITEYPPHTEPVAGRFPARNRIVAGLSLGVLVVEASVNSGSKITAQFAGEYGREVFTVPGVITSPYAEGTKDLANSGAKLVTQVSDILEEFTGNHYSNPMRQLDATKLLEQIDVEIDRQIVELLISQELEVDDIVRLSKQEVSLIMTRLSLLEMQGIVTQQSGRFGIQF